METQALEPQQATNQPPPLVEKILKRRFTAQSWNRKHGSSWLTGIRERSKDFPLRIRTEAQMKSDVAKESSFVQTFNMFMAIRKLRNIFMKKFSPH